MRALSSEGRIRIDEPLTDLEGLVELIAAGAFDERAVARDVVEDALGAELADRLADGAAADAGLLGDGELAHAAARAEFSSQKLLAEKVIDNGAQAL